MSSIPARADDKARPSVVGIFDVDGVLLASPHERAWREALEGYANPSLFTTAMYQAEVAGKPRLSGALAALEALRVRGSAGKAAAYAQAKQERMVKLIEAGCFKAFPDALRLVEAASALGWPMAVASSSKNANRMMRRIPTTGGGSLYDVFSANVCGRDLKKGKPNPEIFLLAADALRMPPKRCVVFEDSPAGIEAALAGGMLSIGVARLGDAAPLSAAGATLVVISLDDLAVDDLVLGRFIPCLA